jgi:hypothetical protein
MNKNIRLRLALPLFVVLIDSVSASGINYPNFSSPTGLIFQGDATIQASAVRLTPAQTGKVGGLWLESKQAVNKSFDTAFQFRITEKVGHGADGFAFVLQSRATPSLGAGGSYLGFVLGGRALAIKFDTYHWHRRAYVKYDEIAVTSCGGEERSEDLGDPLGTTTGPELFSDGNIHTARVRYVPGHLQVFLDDLEKPLLTVVIKLEDLVSFDGGLAWVGFTASTGDDGENHDILNWAFHEPADAAALPQLPASASAGSQTNRQNGPAVNKEQAGTLAKSEPQLIGLPVVDGKGKPGQPQIGLPSAVGLTHQVYASTDLVNWTLVTNLTLYFSDPAATNYDHRFYRFREK